MSQKSFTQKDKYINYLSYISSYIQRVIINDLLIFKVLLILNLKVISNSIHHVTKEHILKLSLSIS